MTAGGIPVVSVREAKRASNDPVDPPGWLPCEVSSQMAVAGRGRGR